MKDYGQEEQEDSNKEILEPPPDSATEPAARYFDATTRNLRFFVFLIDVILKSDYMVYVAKTALDNIDKHAEKVDS